MIQVLIERHIADGMLTTYERNCRSALQQSYVVHGFISGETFHDTLDENHCFLLCKWRALQDWHRWFHSNERRDLMNNITPVLTKPERITVLEN